LPTVDVGAVGVGHAVGWFNAIAVGWCWSRRRLVGVEAVALGSVRAVAVSSVLKLSLSGGAGAVAVGSPSPVLGAGSVGCS
jgi:hypothetical protein